MNTKSYLLTVFISLLSISASAQVEADIHRPSINAEQFGFASKAETALNKGQLSLNIPLMTLKGKGYDLPISLSFYSGDVVFSTEASPIGLGWALLAGGVITKTIRGSDDNDANGSIEHQFNENYITDRYNDWTKHSIFVSDIICDPMPDEYTYSLPGHSGTIEVSFEGNTKSRTLFPDESFRIESTQKGYCITADDGTKYKFESLESRRSNEHTRSTSWFLTSIETTKDGTFTFSYDDEEYVDLSTADDDARYFDRICTKRIKSITSEFGTISFIADDRLDRGSIGNCSISKGKESKRICKIELRDENGSFVKGYKLDNSELFGLDKEFLKYPGCEWCNYRHKLSSVTQYDSVENELPAYVFTYDYKFSKSKLAEVFAWNDTTDPRDSWTSCVANQAYVDLTSNGDPLCTLMSPDTQDAYLVGLTIKSENCAPTADDYFCLSKVDYPNGTTERFYYEDHSYSKVNETTVSTSPTSPIRIQGKRLATRMRFGSKELIQRTEYIYKIHDANYKTVGPSSGVLTNPSIHHATYYTPERERGGWVFRASRIASGKAFNSFMGPPVCYTEVEEVEMDEYDQAINRTIHYFEPQTVSPPVNYIFVYPHSNVLPSACLTKIDNQIYGTKRYWDYMCSFYNNLESYSNDNMTYLAYPVGEFYNTAYVVNQPLKEVFIGKNGDVRSIKKYSYSWGQDYKKYGYKVNSKNYTDYSVDWISVSEYIKRRFRLEEISTTTYYNNGEVRDSICEGYGINYNKGRVSNTGYYRNNGNKCESKGTHYYFPNDILNIEGSSSAIEGVSGMVEKNIVSYPIKTIVRRNNEVIGGECSDFQMHSGIPLLKSIYKIKNTDNNIDCAPIINGDTINYKADIFKEGEIITYDNYLNPEHVKLNETQDRIYVWGYGGQYPIAVIDNMDGTTFQSSANLKAKILQLQSYRKIDTEDKCASLRSLNASIRNMLPASAHITTYTYDPYFGMTSETDDSNLGIIYIYDTFGRMTAKYDENYKKLEEYNYHLKLQQ